MNAEPTLALVLRGNQACRQPVLRKGMRRFTKEEMREILQLAAASSAEPASNEGGFSLEEIQRAGGELGYDPRLVASAAATVATRGTDSSSHPWVHSFTSTHANPLAESTWEDMVAELRTQLRIPGAVRTRADGGKEWIGAAGHETVTVTALPGEGTWKLSLVADRKGGFLGGVCGFSSIFLLLCMNLANSVNERGWGSVDVAYCLASIAVIVPLMAGLVFWTRARGRKRFERLAASLGQLADQGETPDVRQLASDEETRLHVTT
jgi:hypothetical protein